MKKILFLFFLIQSTSIVFSQITIKGEVFVNGNLSRSTIPIYLYNKDSSLISFQNANNGYFEFSINHEGNYIIQAANWYGWYANIFFNFSKDTNIIIEMNVSKQYSQPCRKVFKKKNITFNIPNEEGDKERYKSAIRASKKLKINKDKFLLRIWEEPAFEYGGGCVYELLIPESNTIECKIITFKSDYLEIIAMPNVEKRYESDHDIYINHLDYTITNIETKTISLVYFNNVFNNLLNNYINSDDYCLSMLKGERHPRFDGVMYHMELNFNNHYSFVTYENPECIESLYTQIDLFLAIWKLIEKEFN